MSFENCLREGLIKRDAGAVERVRSSIEIAERFLKSAKRNFDIRDYEMVEIASYNSAFHSARALLFAKGYRERSHYCLAVAIRELYKNDLRILDLVNTFDRLGTLRHNVQYSGALVSEEEAKFFLEFAEEFLRVVKEVVNFWR